MQIISQKLLRPDIQTKARKKFTFILKSETVWLNKMDRAWYSETIYVGVLHYLQIYKILMKPNFTVRVPSYQT